MPVVTWSQSYPGILIDGDQAFITATTRDLNLIKSKPIGKDLLTLLTKRCQGYGCSVTGGATVTISLAPGTLTESAEATAADPDTSAGFGCVKTDRVLPGTTIKLPGRGSSSFAAFNPNAEAQYTALCGLQTPTFVALAHELCHSLHHLSGGLRLANGPGSVGDRFQAMYLQEEAHTVGIGPYANTRISENAVRREWALPERTYYSTPGDCDALPSLA